MQYAKAVADAVTWQIAAGVTSACPSLSPAALYDAGCTHGDAQDAVLANAKARIDGIIDGLRAALRKLTAWP
jgi:hypothetical protein